MAIKTMNQFLAIKSAIQDHFLLTKRTQLILSEGALPDCGRCPTDDSANAPVLFSLFSKIIVREL